jgi:hypothetical protein
MQQEYRAYVLDAKGHVKDYIEFRAPDDQAALAHARQYLQNGHHVDVSILTRVVGRLTPTAH